MGSGSGHLPVSSRHEPYCRGIRGLSVLEQPDNEGGLPTGPLGARGRAVGKKLRNRVESSAYSWGYPGIPRRVPGHWSTGTSGVG